jgi:hypothetical protein
MIVVIEAQGFGSQASYCSEHPTLGPKSPFAKAGAGLFRGRPAEPPFKNPNKLPQTLHQTESSAKFCGVSSILCGPLIPLLHQSMQLGLCL